MTTDIDIPNSTPPHKRKPNGGEKGRKITTWLESRGGICKSAKSEIPNLLATFALTGANGASDGLHHIDYRTTPQVLEELEDAGVVSLGKNAVGAIVWIALPGNEPREDDPTTEETDENVLEEAAGLLYERFQDTVASAIVTKTGEQDAILDELVDENASLTSQNESLRCDITERDARIAKLEEQGIPEKDAIIARLKEQLAQQAKAHSTELARVRQEASQDVSARTAQDRRRADKAERDLRNAEKQHGKEMQALRKKLETESSKAVEKAKEESSQEGWTDAWNFIADLMGITKQDEAQRIINTLYSVESDTCDRLYAFLNQVEDAREDVAYWQSDEARKDTSYSVVQRRTELAEAQKSLEGVESQVRNIINGILESKQ